MLRNCESPVSLDNGFNTFQGSPEKTRDGGLWKLAFASEWCGRCELWSSEWNHSSRAQTAESLLNPRSPPGENGGVGRCGSRSVPRGAGGAALSPGGAALSRRVADRDSAPAPVPAAIRGKRDPRPLRPPGLGRCPAAPGDPAGRCPGPRRETLRRGSCLPPFLHPCPWWKFSSSGGPAGEQQPQVGTGTPRPGRLPSLAPSRSILTQPRHEGVEEEADDGHGEGHVGDGGAQGPLLLPDLHHHAAGRGRAAPGGLRGRRALAVFGRGLHGPGTAVPLRDRSCSRSRSRRARSRRRARPRLRAPGADPSPPSARPSRRWIPPASRIIPESLRFPSPVRAQGHARRCPVPPLEWQRTPDGGAQKRWKIMPRAPLETQGVRKGVN